MPTSLVPRLQLASMQAPALMTRASSASDGCRSAVPATDAGVSESMVAMSGGWVGGMARGAGLLRALVRERTPGDHQPRLGSPVTACVPRVGKRLGSQAMIPSGSPHRSPACPTHTVTHGRWSQGTIPLQSWMTCRSTSASVAMSSAFLRGTWDSRPWRSRGKGGRPRPQVLVGRARRTRRDDPPSDGRDRGRPDNRSIIPLAAVPTGCSSFRLLTLAGRYGVLLGGNCNNNMLRDATGVRRGDTVGL